VPVLPLCACLIISLLTRRWGGLSALLAILTQCVTLAVALSIFFQRLQSLTPPDGAELHLAERRLRHADRLASRRLLVDNLSSLMLAMVCFIALLIQIYSFSYIKTEIGHFPTQGSASMARFFAYMSLFIFSMLGWFSAITS